MSRNMPFPGASPGSLTRSRLRSTRVASAPLPAAGRGGDNADVSGNTTYTMLIAVFLALLAMFILLSAVSERQPHKVMVALDSLDRSFAVDPRLPADNADRLDGIPDGGLRRLAERAGNGPPVDRITVAEPGRLVVVTIAEGDLFTPGGADIRPARDELLNRAVDALRSPPPGRQVDLDALITLGTAPATADPAGMAAARAAGLARALVAHGAPAGRLAVGLDRGRAGQVRFLFTVRPEDDGDAR